MNLTPWALISWTYGEHGMSLIEARMKVRVLIQISTSTSDLARDAHSNILTFLEPVSKLSLPNSFILIAFRSKLMRKPPSAWTICPSSSWKLIMAPMVLCLPSTTSSKGVNALPNWFYWNDCCCQLLYLLLIFMELTALQDRAYLNGTWTAVRIISNRLWLMRLNIARFSWKILLTKGIDFVTRSCKYLFPFKLPTIRLYFAGFIFSLKIFIRRLGQYSLHPCRKQDLM